MADAAGVRGRRDDAAVRSPVQDPARDETSAGAVPCSARGPRSRGGLKSGDRVLYALATRLRAANSFHAPEFVRAVVVRPFGTGGYIGWHVRPVGMKMTVRIYTDEEGVWWVRGWKTKTARAFEVAIALGASS